MWSIKLLNLCILIGVIGVYGVPHVGYLTQQPDFLEPCLMSKPGFTKCFTNIAERLVNQLIIGIPELVQSFGTFDPMRYPKVDYRSDELHVELKDITLLGLKDMIVKEDRLDTKDYHMETKLFVPCLRLEAKYAVAGKLLDIPLNGVGDMFIELDNLSIELFTPTRLYEKGGFTFFNVTDLGVELNTTRVRSHFQNVCIRDAKNKDESIFLNDFFNRNWQDFFYATRPVIKQTLEVVMLDLLQKLYNLIPGNFIVKDIPTSVQLYHSTPKGSKNTHGKSY